MDALAGLSAVEAARKARQGEILAVDLVDAALERISALNGRLAAFMTVTEAGARRTAKRLDALPAAQRGPLHGLQRSYSVGGRQNDVSIARLPSQCAGGRRNFRQPCAQGRRCNDREDHYTRIRLRRAMPKPLSRTPP